METRNETAAVVAPESVFSAQTAPDISTRTHGSDDEISETDSNTPHVLPRNDRDSEPPAKFKVPKGSNLERAIHQHFKAVLETLNRDELGIIARRAIERKLPTKLNSPYSISLGEPLFGSSNAVFPILVDQVPRYVAKIPRNGTVELWDEYLKVNMVSEVGTMQLLERETTMPIPSILDFCCSTQNKSGCPYIIMTYVSGLPLHEIWFGNQSRGVSEEKVHTHRVRILEGVTAAMAQLECVSFHQGGTPVFNEKGKLAGIQSEFFLSHSEYSDECERTQSSGSESDEIDIRLTFGPWNTPREYYTRYLDSYPTDSASRLGEKKLLEMLIGWIPEPEHTRPFVLRHPDFFPHNFIVSEDGELQGIIDWDLPLLVPRSIGNESYPMWLTHDWTPSSYFYEESMEEGADPEEYKYLDSPSSLEKYRQVYCELLEKHTSIREATRTWSVCRASLIVGSIRLVALGCKAGMRDLSKIVSELNSVSQYSKTFKDFTKFLHLLKEDLVPDSVLEAMKNDFYRMTAGNKGN